jgi:hypothetical protein
MLIIFTDKCTGAVHGTPPIQSYKYNCAHAIDDAHPNDGGGAYSPPAVDVAVDI